MALPHCVGTSPPPVQRHGVAVAPVLVARVHPTLPSERKVTESHLVCNAIDVVYHCHMESLASTWRPGGRVEALHRYVYRT